MTKYKNTGFEYILVKAKTLVEALEISPEFQKKRLQKRKKNFNYEGNYEPIIDPLNAFKISFFNLVLDKAKQSLEDRFEQLTNHHNSFGFFLGFKIWEKKNLKNMQQI